MSMAFTEAGNTYFQYDGGVRFSSLQTCTFACWMKTSEGGESNQHTVTMGDPTASNQEIALLYQGNNNNDARFFIRDGSSDAADTAAVGSIQDTWYPLLGTCNASTGDDRSVYFDYAVGGFSGTRTDGSVKDPFLTTTRIGRETRSTSGRAFEGSLAEAAIWGVVLTDEEILAYSKGISALLIRPNELLHYVPLWRDATDLVAPSGWSAPVDAPTVATDHPPIVYPRNMGFAYAAAYVPPVGDRRIFVID